MQDIHPTGAAFNDVGQIVPHSDDLDRSSDNLDSEHGPDPVEDWDALNQ